MANTYSQIYIHIIFSTKNRQPVLIKEIREEVNKYISGIIKNKKQKLIAINSLIDHIHIFIGLTPDLSVSDLVRDIKHYSTLMINEKLLKKTKFKWQDGFGAFSYSHSQIDSVVKYINNQEDHHRKKTFQEEYLEFLKKFNIPYDERYIFG